MPAVLSPVVSHRRTGPPSLFACAATLLLLVPATAARAQTLSSPARAADGRPLLNPAAAVSAEARPVGSAEGARIDARQSSAAGVSASCRRGFQPLRPSDAGTGKLGNGNQDSEVAEAAGCRFLLTGSSIVPRSPTPGEAKRRGAAAVGKYFAGAAVALGVHEGGHVLSGTVFGTSTGVRGVSFGPLPFFAITHEGNLTRRQGYVVSSAGFWTQQMTSEAILSRRPNLRNEHAPFVKGILAFDLVASVAYAGAAFASAGPVERDTLGMAAALRVREPWIGAVVLAPALLDAWRYTHPHAAWARWLSRGAKVGGVLLVIK